MVGALTAFVLASAIVLVGQVGPAPVVLTPSPVNGSTGLFGDGTAAAPSISLASVPTAGLFNMAGNLAVSVGSVARLGFLAGGIQLKSDSSLQWSSGVVNAATDTSLARAAAGQVTLTTSVFSTLGTPANGTEAACTDCAPTTPATCPGTKASCICTSGGVGSRAFRFNNLWYCPF